MKKLPVDIWSDVVCPWCYVGKRRFEAALARFPHRDAVEIRWRAFELDPSAPRVRDGASTYAERLAAKYRTSVEQAEGMVRNMTATGAAEGIDFHFEKAQPGNTFDAHRLLHLAADRGLSDAANERLFRAYMTEGEAIGDRAVLGRLAGDLGLDAGEVEETLAGDAYAGSVRHDEREARELGISGVPFFAIAGRYGVSGAQTPDTLLRVLEQAWGELPEPLVAAAPDGATCGPDGCA